MRQIGLIQILQLLDHIHISIKVNIAVGRMVIPSVEIQELLIGQVGDRFRITAGFIGIGGVREKCNLVISRSSTSSGKKMPPSFHYIQHRLWSAHPSGLSISLVPTFLFEDFTFRIDIGIENSVQVYVHRVLEILVIYSWRWDIQFYQDRVMAFRGRYSGFPWPAR